MTEQLDCIVSGLCKGDTAVLAFDIIQPATGDHPAFLMGRKGETVVVIDVNPEALRWPYLVEGPTNEGRPWWAGAKDFEPAGH